MGIPLIGAQLAQYCIHMTDVIIVGKLGELELGAIVLAAQFIFILLVLGSGVAVAVLPMVAQAHARGDAICVRRAVRMGLWASIGFFVISAPLLLFAKQILLFFGQDLIVSELAGAYVLIGGLSILPALGFNVLRSLCSALNRAGFILYTTLTVLTLNALLAYVFVLGKFGFPAYGFIAAAYIALGVNLLSLVMLVVYIYAQPQLAQFQLFVRFWRPDWPMLREVILLGLPIGLSILAEVGLFTAAALLMGRIGTLELAAHGVAIQLASIAFMIPLGLSQAASVRIGEMVGKEDYLGLRRAAWAVLWLSIGFTIISCVLFISIPHWLASLFIDPSIDNAQLILDYAATLIIVGGLFQIVDGLQAIAMGLLRGIKDANIPLALGVFSYWGIGLGCAYILAFVYDYGGVGVWTGFVAGLLAAAILLLWRFFFLLRKYTPNIAN